MFKIARFLASQTKPDNANIILAGIPYDCTASFRSGSRFAAREIRSYSSESIEMFSCYQNKSLADINFCDIGDMEVLLGAPDAMIKTVENAVTKILTTEKKLLAIGGEHLITLPLFNAIKKVHSEFTMLQLDAHADLRTSYTGSEFSHASVMQLCLKAGLKKLIQVGIRSMTKEEQELRHTSNLIKTADYVEEVENHLTNGEKVYLTVDVDFFDPAYFPATGTPEAGGASFADFIKLIKILRKKNINIIGADIVEFAPEIDHSKISSAFATKLVRELLLAM